MSAIINSVRSYIYSSTIKEKKPTPASPSVNYNRDFQFLTSDLLACATVVTLMHLEAPLGQAFTV